MSVERQKLVTELQAAAKKVADIIRDADTTKKIPDSEWTVGDTIAHIVVSQYLITSFMTGKNEYIPDPENFVAEVSKNLSREYVAKINKKFLSKFSQRNGADLADSLIKEINSLITTGAKFPDDRMFATHYGKMTVPVLFSYCLLHLLAHGSAVAKTLNKSLPVTSANTGLTIPYIKVAMEKLFDKKAAGELTANFVLEMRKVETFVIHIHKGEIKIDTALPVSVDARIALDSLTFFLVANGYQSLWSALFSGKIRLSGRKPWLALKLQSLFQGL